MNNQLVADSALSRFRRLWAGSAKSANGQSDRVHQWLVACYTEPHRSYHTLTHIFHCLRELDRITYMAGASAPLEMALWFHDAIYIPGSSDNELRSADIFEEQCAAFFPEPFIAKVRSLILVTRHNSAPQDEEHGYMVDIDLSSFGLPWEEFLRDSRHVRAEQKRLDDDAYYAAQGSFLCALLNRPRFFYTDLFYSLYEQAARANIARFMALEASGPKV